ncbi:toprim domain-containing protein [Methanobacterium alcaliphilum]|uniref:toprim domain-containing protein n=1 Tax=Methanobacterium alcaliphilum TaxID=392018 RepID=UPI00200B0190|nr:toprim domain-containing protein [Methanobacterium alcaliphilum]MCK9152024.1 toprim domain-containing protein [Methanobacterium alcaliphilum]
MDNKSPIDVRIIVEGASDVESVSRAMQDVALGAEYHITISSIIPTTSLDIARRAVDGADVVLIATDVDAPGRELAEKFQDALKDQVGHLERMKFPYGHDVEYIDPLLIKDEIKNAIIRAGLSSITNIKHFRELETEMDDANDKIRQFSLENQDLLSENHNLAEKLEELSNLNQKLQSELEKVEGESSSLKKEYSRLESQYSHIHKRNLLEVFSIKKLWREAFDDILKDEDQIIFATNQFKPDNIVVGQGYISARSKEEALEWLKVIKTALIFIDPDKSEENKEDLEEEDNLDNRFQNIWD